MTDPMAEDVRYVSLGDAYVLFHAGNVDTGGWSTGAYCKRCRNSGDKETGAILTGSVAMVLSWLYAHEEDRHAGQMMRDE